MLNLAKYGFAASPSRAEKADPRPLPGTVVGEVHRGREAVYRAIVRATSPDGQDNEFTLAELADQCRMTVAAFERHVEALIMRGDVRRNTEGLGRVVLVPCRERRS